MVHLQSSVDRVAQPDLTGLRRVALNSHVLVVATVVVSPAAVAARADRGLRAAAGHVIQPDLPRAITRVRHATAGQAQLPAHHLGVGDPEGVVADGAPLAAVEHLQPPGRAVRQPDHAFAGLAGARDADVLLVAAPVRAEAQVGAVAEGGLRACAVDAVQPDQPCARVRRGQHRAGDEAQLATDDFGCLVRESLTADSAPLAVVEHLHSPAV
mmetsp:Transcript_172864/g.420480  ORF Transcript_172864/g.420480 Transcript_172864/m.420480 type:complete len:212 (-) Transcript_172864:128-763(-)